MAQMDGAVSYCFWEICSKKIIIKYWSSVYTYTQNHYSLIHWSPPKFSLLAVGYELTRDRPLSPLMMQVALMLLSLVSTQKALLISCSTRSAKLLAILPESHCSCRDYRPRVHHHQELWVCMHETN